MLNLIEAFKRPYCGKLVEEFGAAYNKLFAPYEDTHVRFLEIGVWIGVSLQIWKDFFNSIELFAIDSDVISIQLARKFGATGFEGDQSYKPFMDWIASEIGNLDIVIDDGGHWCDDQQVSFNALWPIINKGGIYVIEDLWVADERTLDGYESTLVFLDKLDIRKEYFIGNKGFEKDICVLYKD